MIYQSYKLNLIPDQVPLSVWCSQYDADSRTFQFEIYKGSELYTIPSGSTVTVRGTKQDNTGFEYSCTYDGSAANVIVKDQMTIFAGKVPCELRIMNGSDILGTANFNLMVERTPLETDVTISETDLPLLEEAEQNAIRAEQAASQATSVLASAVKSVNNVLPDANGNVNVQNTLTAGTGIIINNNVISNQFETLVSPDLDTVTYNYSGYVRSTTNNPSGTNANGELLVIARYGNNLFTKQIYAPYGSNTLYMRSNNNGTWTEWVALAERPLVITTSSFSSLPQTITNASITSDMVVINSVLSNPSAVIGDLTVNTSNGSLTISGSISGSTTLTLYLMKGA